MFLQVSVCPQGGVVHGPGGGVVVRVHGPRGVHGHGGGVCAWSWGVPGAVGGGVCAWSCGGVPHPRGVCVWSRGVCAWFWGGVGIPACTEAAPLPGRDGYCCGRYASYWNAFLFDLLYKLLIGWQTSRHLCYGPIY